MKLMHNVLHWLELLLYERFGHTFTLHTQPSKTLRIMLEADSRYIELPLDAATFSRADSDLPCTQWDAAAEGWHSALGDKLPTPGASTLPLPLIQITAQGYHIHYDILGLTYWMLSRQEEVGRTDLDNHGRFPATSSHAYKHGYLERPIVDEWLHILSQVIQRTWPSIELKQHRFSMKVSHDVDLPSRYGFCSLGGIARAVASDLLKRGDLTSALRAPWIRMQSKSKLHPADPANTFDWLMDISDRYGMKSAFYFICGCTDPQRDADYAPEHPAIRNLMRRIYQRGHEIGLHPSYNTYQNPEIIAQEAQRLLKIAKEEGIEQTSWGGRMHYLRWEHPTTLQGWELADMSYDSTLGYADLPGFRCGTCFEYPAFDPSSGFMLKLRIRPLIAMECTIIAERYMALGTGEKALLKFNQLKNSCAAVDGCFTLLWHNTQLMSKENRKLYQQVISDKPTNNKTI